MKLKLLDRPRDPGPKQDAWDEARATLERLAWAEYRGRRRKVRGSRRSRKLFLERVVSRAIQRQDLLTIEAYQTLNEVGEIVEVALSDWREEGLFSTVVFEPSGP